MNDTRELHRPVHDRALSDARDHLRRAVAAIRACHLPRQGDAAELATVDLVLDAQLVTLEQIARRCPEAS